MIRTADFIKALELRVLVPTTHEEMPIDSADINRPGLQLAGFYENFANKRPQVIGKAEMSYLDSLDNNLRLANNKLEDLTIKKLTRNNPTMKQKFEDLQ